MTRRGAKTTTHTPRTHAPAGGKHDLLLHRHRMLRRTASFVLARKYRFNYPGSRFDPWPTESELREMNSARYAATGGGDGKGDAQLTSAFSGPKGFSRDELLNFWRELSLVVKRRLLRIRREVYLTALDEFLVQQNLCCECHDNVIAEWEDHERKRSGSRSLQDVFSVFPPFLDDEDDEDDDEDDEDDDVDEDDDEDDEDDEDAFSGDMNEESDEEALTSDEVGLDDEEVVFKYELEHGRRRGLAGTGPGGINGTVGAGASGSSRASLLTDEYLAALEVGKRQEDELLRLIQKEERYIIIREDHSDFIMDLIRCGEQFSYLSPFRPGFDGEESDDEDEDDAECPGANTSHLAQEYLLEVLAIKFREQLEDAYQEALQHSLAVQAELLRDELAGLQASQKQSVSSSKKKKNKEKKKRKKKDASAIVATPAARPKQTAEAKKSPDVNAVRQPSPDAKSSRDRKMRSGSDLFKDAGVPSWSGLDADPEVGDPEDDELDREVEQFRLLLEKINAESSVRIKKKLVLPPGTFARLSSTTVS